MCAGCRNLGGGGSLDSVCPDCVCSVYYLGTHAVKKITHLDHVVQFKNGLLILCWLATYKLGNNVS